MQSGSDLSLQRCMHDDLAHLAHVDMERKKENLPPYMSYPTVDELQRILNLAHEVAQEFDLEGAFFTFADLVSEGILGVLEGLQGKAGEEIYFNHMKALLKRTMKEALRTKGYNAVIPSFIDKHRRELEYEIDILTQELKRKPSKVEQVEALREWKRKEGLLRASSATVIIDIIKQHTRYHTISRELIDTIMNATNPNAPYATLRSIIIDAWLTHEKVAELDPATLTPEIEERMIQSFKQELNRPAKVPDNFLDDFLHPPVFTEYDEEEEMDMVSEDENEKLAQFIQTMLNKKVLVTDPQTQEKYFSDCFSSHQKILLQVYFGLGEYGEKVAMFLAEKIKDKTNPSSKDPTMTYNDVYDFIKTYELHEGPLGKTNIGPAIQRAIRKLRHLMKKTLRTTSI